MVKNTKGGNKGKRGARRHFNQTDKSNKIRLKQDDDEHYAKIIRMHGNAAEILCDDGVTRLLIWRQKFRGRNKRDNTIAVNGVVLTGIRNWEIVAKEKKPKADLLFVYSENHIIELYKKKDIPRFIFPDGVQSSIDNFDKHATNIDVNEEIDTTQNVIIRGAEQERSGWGAKDDSIINIDDI